MTNKVEPEPTIWAFMTGRGGHEKTLGELKQDAALSSVVTDDWDADNTWQLLSALNYNFMRNFQLEAELASPGRNGRNHYQAFRFVGRRRKIRSATLAARRDQRRWPAPDALPAGPHHDQFTTPHCTFHTVEEVLHWGNEARLSCEQDKREALNQLISFRFRNSPAAIEPRTQ